MNRKLRQKAQEVLKKKGIIDQSLYEKDIETLVEELSIYQIELEQQNNELRETQERLIKTNERYTDLFNNAPIGYLILDKNYTIKKINNTLCHILEYDMNELEGTSFVKLIEPSFQDIFYLSFRSTLDQDITNTSDIKLKKAKNGILFAHLIMDAESLPEEEKTLRIALIDIGHQKELEEKLINETEKAKESDRLKSAFLANISHEIRTPLNGILGFASVLSKKEVDKEKVFKYGNVINTNGKRLLELINNILDISKIESGNMPVNIAPFSPSQLIYDINELFKIKAQKENNTIITNIPKTYENIQILSDELKISQILSNLIGNAVKFTNNGTIEVGFNIKNTKVVFYVKDNGKGIPKKEIKSLFDRFYQAEDNYTSKNKGTGLGLSLSKSLIELLKGEIWAESEEEKGSIFSFSIPKQLLNDQHTKNKTAYTPSVKNINNKILLAEDENDSAEYLKFIFSQHNIDTVHALNGKEAIELLNKNHDINIIFLDIKMPLMNGYEACKEIRKKDKNIPIIALTAFSFENERDKAFQTGFNEYLIKPVSEEIITATVNKYKGYTPKS